MKPSIPKGTRDFTPEQMVRRNYLFDTIKEVYALHGFRQIETPAVEKLSSLMGKYGEEGDKLLFKILNSGDYMSKISDEDLADKNSTKLVSKFSDKGLRYDLTVPFARFVVQHRNEIKFPFRRFQIQPVWRADRPQKGRYREFYQCDADIIGTDSLLNEVELLQIIDEVFVRLQINVCTKINNRKILAGIAEIIGEPDRIIDITVAIDKLDKIGLEKVNLELHDKGVPITAVEKLQPILALSGTNQEKTDALSSILAASEIGIKGVEELKFLFDIMSTLELKSELELDLTLARGLNYYTGTIIEVIAKDVKMGSITGGGRYDNLTGVFGLNGVSGVGISFGADRIYDILNQLELYPKDDKYSTKLIFLNFGDQESLFCLPFIKALREAGVCTELYPDAAKIKKQMIYANDRHIPFTAIVGESEMNEGLIALKNMETGEQEKVTIAKLVLKMQEV